MDSSLTKDTRANQLEQWMYEYENAILRMCTVYLADRAMAEDATQDTFMKVWRNMHKFQGRNSSSIKTWIMRIAINTCRDYRRSAWYRHIHEEKPLDDLLNALCPLPQEDRELFLDVMNLPDKEKQAVLLYYYQDMTMQEAAAVLGITAPALLRRLKKAYRLLSNNQEGRNLN